jgi:hypothetical protein
LAEKSTACPAGVVAVWAVERAWLRAFCWRFWPPERERDELDLAFEREPLDFERALEDLALLPLDFPRLLLPDFAREPLLLEREDAERELEDFARDPPDREDEPPDLEPLDLEPPDFRCPPRPSAMSALPH